MGAVIINKHIVMDNYKELDQDDVDLWIVLKFYFPEILNS